MRPTPSDTLHVQVGVLLMKLKMKNFCQRSAHQLSSLYSNYLAFDYKISRIIFRFTYKNPMQTNDPLSEIYRGLPGNLAKK